MDYADEGDNYAPRSPDLSAPQEYQPEPVHPQHHSYRGSISQASPFTPTGGPDSYFGKVDIAGPPFGLMKHEEQDEDYGYDKRRRGKKMKTEDEGMMSYDDGALSPDGGIEVKTKFPVARIKRIMQADEDVGKVAQVTPVVVSKALELFMISLVTKAAAEAKSRSSKRVLASHLKQAVIQDEQFDFLNEIVSKVADAPAPSSKQVADGDSDEAEGKKKRVGGRRRRKDADEF